MTERLLSGKAAIITGAARGIGKATALCLAERGCGVILSGREENTLEKVAMEVTERGGRAVCVAADLRADGTPGLLVQKAHDGFNTLDILVNAAGFAQPKPLIEMELRVWQNFLDLHLTATFLCAQAAARDMVARQKKGRIVNLSSIAASMAMYGNGPYGAVKAAVSSLTRTFAIELAPHGISVNAVAPGPVDTEGFRAANDEEKYRQRSRSIPFNRLADPAEVAELITFLVSPGAEYITGQTLTIDGGAAAVGCYSFETYKRTERTGC
jgi:NAD(P)-dependent dehydrogenase (short-subunit alcohol dehydrogenase family)